MYTECFIIKHLPETWAETVTHKIITTCITSKEWLLVCTCMCVFKLSRTVSWYWFNKKMKNIYFVSQRTIFTEKNINKCFDNCAIRDYLFNKWLKFFVTYNIAQQWILAWNKYLQYLYISVFVSNQY